MHSSSLPERPPRPRPSTSRERTSQNQRGDEGERERTKLTPTQEGEECLIDTRTVDGEFVVLADFCGASVDDITVGVDTTSNELVIGKSGSIVVGVPLPWDAPAVRLARFNNGVLEVRVELEGTDAGEKST